MRSAWLLLIFSLPSQAGIINGSFEQGMYGWHRDGTTAAVYEVGPFAPTHGKLQAVLETSAGAAFPLRETVDLDYGAVHGGNFSDEKFSDAVGLPQVVVANPFFPEHSSQPTLQTTLFELARQDFKPGREEMGPLERCFGYLDVDECFTHDSSGIWQSFKAGAGRTISFDFNFTSGEGTQITDAAFVTLVTANTFAVFLLADSVGNGIASIGDSVPVTLLTNSEHDRATGYHSFSLIVPETGWTTLGFGVFNSSDSAVSSGLLIDNVRLIPVPEPATLSLVALGLLAVCRPRRVRA